MKTAFYLIAGLHGVIHLFGFLKAFGIVAFDAISHPISRFSGVIWLMAFLLFAATVYLRLSTNPYWWLVGIVAAAISQVLVISVWSDARFATIPNLLVLLVCGLAFLNSRYTDSIANEREVMLAKAEVPSKLTPVNELPPLVQKWLSRSGVNNSTAVSSLYLRQKLRMKMKPAQKGWTIAEADQFFTLNPPAFNWAVDMKMNGLLPIKGRDRFEQGKGEMQIKLASALPVVNEQNNPKIDEGSLQRYLAEIAWFPSAARMKYIEWETLDDNRAKATLSYGGSSGSGIFEFDEEGRFVSFTAMRFKGGESDAERVPWRVVAEEYAEMQGFYIPVRLRASWELKDSTWTWLKMEVTEVIYNPNSKKNLFTNLQEHDAK